MVVKTLARTFFRNNNTTGGKMERKHGGRKITFTEQIIRK